MWMYLCLLCVYNIFSVDKYIQLWDKYICEYICAYCVWQSLKVGGGSCCQWCVFTAASKGGWTRTYISWYKLWLIIAFVFGSFWSEIWDIFVNIFWRSSHVLPSQMVKFELWPKGPREHSDFGYFATFTDCLDNNFLCCLFAPNAQNGWCPFFPIICTTLIFCIVFFYL